MIIKRVGGKTKISNWIVSNSPAGNIFVDVFGGSGAVLEEVINSVNKCRFVYNDLDDKVYNFFNTLKNNPNELSHLISLTPYSRKFFNHCFSLLKNKDKFNELTNLDKSVAFLVVNRQSFGAKMSKDWSITRDGEINYKTWSSLPEYIFKVYNTWKNVYLENLNYIDLFKKWDSENSIFYCDPPYESVEDDYYDVNKDEGFNHIELFENLQHLKGSYFVSYYGGTNDDEDSDLLKLYKNSGCNIIRKSVKKHLSNQIEKQSVIETLIIKNKTNKFLLGKKLKHCGIIE